MSHKLYNYKLYLKRGREDSLKRFHPWVFSGAIKSIDSNVQEGDIVDVYSSEREFLGRGHYQEGSISLRVLTFLDENIDYEFYENRIKEAYYLRKKLGLVDNQNTTAYRLIHGEGDCLPGLIIDIYGDTAVLQAHSLGMWKSAEMIAAILPKVCKNVQYIYNKSSGTLQGFKEQDSGNKIPVEDTWISKKRDLPIEIYENGNSFEINPEEGQKTGFFIDQRENRLLLQKYTNGASVLNLFCYTGGFSVYAAKGGAQKIVSVDSSSKAVALANRNMELNFGQNVNHNGVVGDVFDFLRETNEKYNLLILDPPAFAKHHSAVKNALQAYKRLNAKAMERIENGGILFTFSCSQAINEQQFLQSVFSAAAIAGRKAKILHFLNQPADHPINIYHPEGNYLKGLVVYLT